MRADLKEACEIIDAEIFSGEGLFDKELLEYIARWDRAGLQQQDETELPHNLLFARVSDAALRYCQQTGPSQEAETVVEVSVLHTGAEQVVTNVKADTRLIEPVIWRIGGRG